MNFHKYHNLYAFNWFYDVWVCTETIGTKLFLIRSKQYDLSIQRQTRTCYHTEIIRWRQYTNTHQLWLNWCGIEYVVDYRVRMPQLSIEGTKLQCHMKNNAKGTNAFKITSNYFWTTKKRQFKHCSGITEYQII